MLLSLCFCFLLLRFALCACALRSRFELSWVELTKVELGWAGFESAARFADPASTMSRPFRVRCAVFLI